MVIEDCNSKFYNDTKLPHYDWELRVIIPYDQRSPNHCHKFTLWTFNTLGSLSYRVTNRCLHNTQIHSLHFPRGKDHKWEIMVNWSPSLTFTFRYPIWVYWRTNIKIRIYGEKSLMVLFLCSSQWENLTIAISNSFEYNYNKLKFLKRSRCV